MTGVLAFFVITITQSSQSSTPTTTVSPSTHHANHSHRLTRSEPLVFLLFALLTTVSAHQHIHLPGLALLYALLKHVTLTARTVVYVNNKDALVLLHSCHMVHELNELTRVVALAKYN